MEDNNNKKNHGCGCDTYKKGGKSWNENQNKADHKDATNKYENKNNDEEEVR